jgi:Lysyl oxidase
VKVRGKSLLLLGLILALVFLTTSAQAAGAADQLPDLRMASLTRGITIDKTTLSSRKLLRFSTVIVNMGAGPFELHGSRPDTSTPEMSVTQRIYDDAGGHRDVPTTATMFFAGDGHNHWHTKDLQSAELDYLDNGGKIAAWAKQGFCFYDNGAFRLSLPGAPRSAVYTDCGHDSTQLTTTMGLSVGWGDWYYYYLAFQWIDITGLPSGRYRLFVATDAANWFQEIDESNNTTWADILLSPKGFSVLGYGPSADDSASLEPAGSGARAEKRHTKRAAKHRR